MQSGGRSLVLLEWHGRERGVNSEATGGEFKDSAYGTPLECSNASSLKALWDCAVLR
jgi:hypothetical protein